MIFQITPIVVGTRGLYVSTLFLPPWDKPKSSGRREPPMMLWLSGGFPLETALGTF